MRRHSGLKPVNIHEGRDRGGAGEGVWVKPLSCDWLIVQRAILRRQWSVANLKHTFPRKEGKPVLPPPANEPSF